METKVENQFDNKLGKKFWAAMLIFGLIGQVAWIVENMYLNVFIYKMFHASAEDISLMVGASSVAATLTTIFSGALSDKLGKRKIMICLGYIAWGISILAFGWIRMDVLTPMAGSVTEAAALGVTLTILLDCVMTFFGSTANDACYNAWLTEKGNDSNRGKIEGFNSMMPLVSILVVFGGFMGFDLNQSSSWTTIYMIIGGVVFIIGILGFFLIEESCVKTDTAFWENLVYSFRWSVLKENKLLYAALGTFALFGISIQTFMPYLILYYEQSLKMANYVFIMAPAILLAAVITALYGKVYDMSGFKTSVIPVTGILMVGYVILLFGRSTVPVFIGSLFMMAGYMTGMSVFGAMIRDNIPEGKAGQFQGIRIIGQVLVPGMIGPAIGAYVLRDAEEILNNDGTYSFLPNENIWIAAIVTALVLCVGLGLMFRMIRVGHHDLWSEEGKNVQEGKVPAWEEYPRPQMKREGYILLNGTWTLNGSPIRVPFPPQALLSGYEKKVGSRLTYETEFECPKDFTKKRVLLHFGAVDQVAEVWVNEKLAGKHESGYLPFTLDITELVKRNGVNKLRVEVTDTLSKIYPYGKQTKKRGGMWYTPVSGIWQTVWLENVPENPIEKVKITPDLDGFNIEVMHSGTGFTVEIELESGKWHVQKFEENSGRVNVSDLCQPIHWTPENPHLYQMHITAGNDKVETYGALRTIEIASVNGVPKVCLNKKPIFLHGVLDQGYYSDGLYLAANEKEYEHDILRMKELGYNMLRKHIKVEPECFYYACDKLGMLVVQDMVNSGPYSFLRDTVIPTFVTKKGKDAFRGITGKRKTFFVMHTKETIETLYNHPSIVAYTIFNEGWGQFQSDFMYEFVKKLDETRLVDSTSGWYAQQKSDFDSEHIYFKVVPLEVKERPLFVSECGGYTMAEEGHYYSKYNQYGYGTCENSTQLTDKIIYMYENMILESVAKGVCGCVYTQVSDVEDEINGLYTYDRAVCKVDKSRMKDLARRLQEKVKK